MSSRQDRPIFTYQTRVSVTPEQDQLLREYARRFGHIERTLFADLQKGKDANQLKTEYVSRFDITARQFNALRIQLQGKIGSIQKLIPVHMANLKTKIRRPGRPSPRWCHRFPAATSCIRSGGAWQGSN